MKGVSKLFHTNGTSGLTMREYSTIVLFQNSFWIAQIKIIGIFSIVEKIPINFGQLLEFCGHKV